MTARCWRLPPAAAVLSGTWLYVPQAGAPESGASGHSENYHLEAKSPPAGSQICHEGLEREPHAAERLGPQAHHARGSQPLPASVPEQVFADCPGSVHCEELKDPEVWTHHPALRLQADAPRFPSRDKDPGGRGAATQGQCVKKLNHTGKKSLLFKPLPSALTTSRRKRPFSATVSVEPLLARSRAARRGLRRGSPALSSP